MPGRLRILVCLCVAITACTKAEVVPSADGGTAGTSGRADAGGEDAGLSCMDRELRASTAVSAALEAASLTCSMRSDCEMISIDTDCHAACGALVSTADVAAIAAAITKQNESTCAGFEDDGCKRDIPPCVPPRDFDCVAGRCTEADDAPAEP